MRRYELLDRFVVACLLIVSVMTPWALGGVLELWQFLLFVPLIFATLASLAVLITSGQEGPPIPAIAWPLLLSTVLAASYLAAIPPDVLSHLSPRAHDIWSHVDRDLAPLAAAWEIPSTGGEESHVAYSMSLARGATRYQLSFLLLAAAALVLANRHLDSPNKRRLFFVTIAINGVVLVFFGIIQSLTFNGKLFWMLPLEQGGNPFAAFVNRNNAAGYLNMCLGAAMALVATRRLERRPDLWSFREGRRGGGSPIQDVDVPTLGWSLVLVMLTAGVFCSLSRGGALALVTAALFTAWYTRHSALGRTARRATGVTLVLGLGFAAWLGRGAILKDRVLQSFTAEQIAREGRFHNWQDALASAWEFLPFGSGLGTYRYVYLFHEDSLVAAWFQHAENQYLETLVELGLPGITLALVAIGLLLRSVALWLRGDHAPNVYATGAAGMFVITSQLVHAGFDFGLVIPSNMLLFGIWCGLLSAGPPPASLHGSRGRQAISLIVLLTISGGLVWSGWEVFHHGQSMRRIRASLDINEDKVIASKTIGYHVASLEGQLARRPRDPQLWYYLARLHTLEFRAATYDELTRQMGSPDERRWQLTAPTELHARWTQMALKGQSEQLARLRDDPYVRRYLGAAARDLTHSLRTMPLRPQAYLALAEMSGFFADPAESNVYIARAKALAPADPDVLYRAGLLELQAGQTTDAICSWRRCLEGSTRNNRAIIMIAKQRMTSDQFSQLLPEDARRVIQIARAEFSAGEDKSVRKRLAEVAHRRLDVTTSHLEPTGIQNYLMGAIQALLGEQEAAIAEYRRAVERQPGQTAWRSELVNALIRQGWLEEALAEARTCARHAPRQIRYRLQVQQIEKKLAAPPL